MNTLISLCLAAVLVAAVLAEGYKTDPYAKKSYDSKGYGKPTYGKSTYGKPTYDDHKGYGGGKGYGHHGKPTYDDHKGYGGGKGYGHGKPTYDDHKGYGGGKGYGHAAPSYGGHGGPKLGGLLGRAPLNKLDKLFERVRDVQDQVKTFSEQMEALSALLSIQEKKLKELVVITFTKLKETDMRQNEAIKKLDAHLVELARDSAALSANVAALNALNEDNTVQQLKAEGLWAAERALDVRQDRQIGTLYTTVRLLKDKLFQIKDNRFAVFFDVVERATTLLGSVNARETRRMCEVGQVTLDAVDGRVEYQYQNWFGNVPQILYGLLGFNFNLDTLEDPAHYGYGYPAKEPEAIGLRINGWTTKTGIILELFSLGFGDVSVVSADVGFQACTIGPGTEPVKH